MANFARLRDRILNGVENDDTRDVRPCFLVQRDPKFAKVKTKFQVQVRVVATPLLDHVTDIHMTRAC